MKKINTYIYEKLQIAKGKEFKNVNPINVIRNTVISLAKDIWGDASGFGADEDINIESENNDKIIKLYFNRLISISDIRKISFDVQDTLNILEHPYKAEYGGCKEDPNKPAIIFTKK